MGRYGYKTEADGLKKISTSFLKKHGYFRGWLSGTITWTSGWDESKSSVSIVVSTLDAEEYLRIYYTQTDRDTGEKKDFDYKIPLTSTPCHLGGKRYWFTCAMSRSGRYCGRRVGVLYKGGDYFACRHCYNLTYSSRNENKSYRSLSVYSVFRLDDKIEKLEARIRNHSYAGRPTKKQRRLERLYEQANRAYGALGGLGKDKML